MLFGLTYATQKKKEKKRKKKKEKLHNNNQPLVQYSTTYMAWGEP
jgi:hypothetical protein